MGFGFHHAGGDRFAKPFVAVFPVLLLTGFTAIMGGLAARAPHRAFRQRNHAVGALLVDANRFGFFQSAGVR